MKRFDSMKGALIAAIFAALAGGGCAQHSSKASAPAARGFVTPKLEILDQQVKNNSENAQAFSNRGYTLALLGRKEAARADLAKALSLKPTAPLYNSAGFAYFNMGDYADALRVWKTAAEMSQNRSRYDYYSLAMGHWGVGDAQKALENYQMAVEREPKFGEYKTLDERTAEWTPAERRAMHEMYTLWSKTWRP